MKTAEKIEGLQTFRNEDGFIICVKMGWIAVDIPSEECITEAECVGTSMHLVGNQPMRFYDIALNGSVRLHTYHSAINLNILPFYYEEFPL